MPERCKTRYPILLIHGTGFRDWKRLGYWGRIPAALEAEGARVFYGEQDAWGSVAHNAQRLRGSLDRALSLTGCEKVNIIAHSKGGIEARYLASALQYADRIASITTISSPHHGSRTMDSLMRFPRPLLRLAAGLVNGWYRLLGDENPDFLTTCTEFTTTHMQKFNAAYPPPPGTRCTSVATAMRRSRDDFIVAFAHFIVNRIEGENDGLVTTESARWADFQGVWRGTHRRGISHADSVDARRRNLRGVPLEGGYADIRDAYIDLVKALKAEGL